MFANSTTRWTYWEYQILLLSLAAAICLAIFLIEIALRRFQVLPMLFPGMFTVRARRFYFFDFDISDGPLGKQVRANAKMLIRLTVCIVLSYLWNHCVLQASQNVGKDFPVQQCSEGADCFYSRFHYMTFLERQYTGIDCNGPHNSFDTNVVVSCIKFIQPAATTWLMHSAIAHSVIQLNCKAYVVLVWVVGYSAILRYTAGFLVIAALSVFIGLFFGAQFVSSWLSFVMSLSVPLYMYMVYRSGSALTTLRVLETMKLHLAIEERLNAAFLDMEAEATRAESTRVESDSQGSPVSPNRHKGFRRFSRGLWTNRSMWGILRKISNRKMRSDKSTSTASSLSSSDSST